MGDNPESINKMGDNPKSINKKNKTTSFLYDDLKEFLGQKIQRKKRSLIQYIDCPGHPETLPATTNKWS